MARHMRLDAETGVTTLDEVSAQERAQVDANINHSDRGGPVDPTDVARDEGDARERFGGMNLGACFFGWLVAIASAVLLTTIVGAVLAAVEATVGVAQIDPERQVGAIGIAAGVVLLVGYYVGGYVAGRMSRFDGGRQGFGVWAIGLVVTFVAVGLGATARTQDDLVGRVDLPRVPMSTEQLGWGAVTAAAVVLGTLLTATLGGVIGRHYHHRVDRAVRSQ